MRILHLLPTNRFSGAENVACQIIGLFSGNPDYDMAYCSPEGPIRNEVEGRNIRFIGLESFGRKQVKKAIKEFNPDLIHAHDMRATLMSAVISGNLPVVSHIHCNAKGNNKLSARSVLYYISSIRCKHIIWVSKSSYENYYFHRQLSRKSTILYNVIDEDVLRQRSESIDNQLCGDVVYVGRLSEEKDPIRLMKILRLVADALPDVKVAIVGSGEMEEQTKAECHRLGLDGNVSFTGFIPNPSGILKSSKVMVMTSIMEGTPMSILEAQALGIPVVSTPVGGIVDVITDGENGFLSDEDSVLAERIIDLVSSESLFEKMSSDSLEKSHKYNDIEAYRQTLDCIYKQSSSLSNQ